jgi:tetratricopeptide (TPR) repeat protein
MILRLTIIIVGIFILTISGNSQNIDSLKAELENKSGTARRAVLFELAQACLLQRQHDDAKKYAWENYTLSKKAMDSVRMLESYRQFATSLRRLGDDDSAINIYLSLIPYKNKLRNTEEYNRILTGLGISYFQLGKHDKALKYYLEGLVLNEKKKDTFNISIALNNIALVYYKLRDRERAITYYKKSIELKKKKNEKHDLDLALVNLGLCYQFVGDYVNAQKCLQEGLAFCREHCRPDVETNGLFGMGIQHTVANEYDSAKIYFLKAYKLAAENQNIRLAYDNLYNLGNVCTKQNRLSEALYYLNKADSLAQHYPAYRTERCNVYRQFATTQAKRKDYKSQAYYQQKFIEVNDSANYADLVSNLMREEAEFVTRESDEKMRAQQEVLRLKEDVIQNQKKVNLISTVLVVLSICLLILLWKNFQRRKKINVILDTKLRDRSKEFNEAHADLVREINDQKLILNQAANELQTSLHTMQRVLIMALTEVSEPIARNYLTLVEKTRLEFANRLETTLRAPTTSDNVKFERVTNESNSKF